MLHLLYARFWHKVLFDLGCVSTAEPFFKLVNQGLILGEDGQKMSKSRGNVVNPDDILKEFGADAFRLYEMFMGPLQEVKPWNTQGVAGVYKFLGRVWRLFVDEKSETAYEQAETTAATSQEEMLDLIMLDGAIVDVSATPAQLKTLHACIKKVTEDLDGLRFNTAISAMMVFVNEAMTWESKPLPVMKPFLQLLAPFAPHLAEELWARLHSTFGQLPPSLTYAPWPKFDPALLVESEIEIPVQVNGKFRDVIKVAVDADNATIEAAAKAAEKVAAVPRRQNHQESHHRAQKDGEFDRVVADSAPTARPRLRFFSARQNGLEMRRLFLGGDDADFDFLEAGFFEPAMQIALGKSRPAVAVKLMRLLEVVLEQIEQQNLPARLQNLVRAANAPPAGFFGVMQRLAQDHEVNAVRLQSAGFANRPGGIPGSSARSFSPWPRRTRRSFPSCPRR